MKRVWGAVRRRMAGRLGHAIQWRVRAEMDTERELVEGLRVSLEKSMVSTAEQFAVLHQVLEDLQERLRHLESTNKAS